MRMLVAMLKCVAVPPFAKGGLGGICGVVESRGIQIPLNPPLHPQGVRRWVPRCCAATLPQSKGEVRVRNATSAGNAGVLCL